MKKLFVVGLMVCLMVGMVGCTSIPVKSHNPKIYTAYNIWVNDDMKCINYKIGDFIPAGTEIGILERLIILSDKCFPAQTGGLTNAIKLLTMEGKVYHISFVPKWHPNKTIKNYVKYLHSEKTFEELTIGMNELEIEAIKQGKIIVGMSKEAVLLSYGIPAEHRTPNLESNKWRYWMNKRKQKIIYFYDNRAVTRTEYIRLCNDSIIRNTKEL